MYDAAWALDLPASLLGCDVHLGANFQQQNPTGPLQALDALAQSVTHAPLAGDVRVTADVQVARVLAAHGALSVEVP
ncbi:MAG: hypothetical protein NTV92_05345, partial [Candidatus Bipolaricaulota bacterium]|nr:hypothetical protein [Candidatus Bipolaricaulota bacterium]